MTAAFIERLTPASGGIRVAVKDVFDVAGLPTTLGSRLVAAQASPAAQDAACLAGVRAAEARGEAAIVGKTNLHELAFGATGTNPWFGTPANPLDALLIPGGSSSGSAVAVAAGEADVALGTDTAGSVRVPAACCGIAAIMATPGRIPGGGLWPLSSTLDSVGIFARSVQALRAGLRLVDPTLGAARPPLAGVVGLVSRDAHPMIQAAVVTALTKAELTIVPIDLGLWDRAAAAGRTLVDGEAWGLHGQRFGAHLAELAPDVADRLRAGREVGDDRLAGARGLQTSWQAQLAGLLRRVEVLAVPTLSDFPPQLTTARRIYEIRNTLPVNVAGPAGAGGSPAYSAVPGQPSGHWPAPVGGVAPRGGGQAHGSHGLSPGGLTSRASHRRVTAQPPDRPPACPHPAGTPQPGSP